MQRITTPTRAIDLFGVGKDGFRNGDLANGIAPTDFNAEWVNGVQEELLKVIEAAGIAPSVGDLGQLLKAIGLVTPGRLIRTSIYRRIGAGQQVYIDGAPPTAVGATVYNSLPSTKFQIAEVYGGSGAGGSAASTAAGEIAMGGGGATGGKSVSLIFGTLAGIAVTCGLAGAAAAAGINGGGPGGTSSFGSFLQATGGLGGGSTRGAPPLISPGGTAGVGTGGNLLNSSGEFGTNAVAVAVGNGVSGAGASSDLGGGASPRGSQNPGIGFSAQSPASAGAGAYANQSNATGFSGGAGEAGLIIVREYA